MPERVRTDDCLSKDVTEGRDSAQSRAPPPSAARPPRSRGWRSGAGRPRWRFEGAPRRGRHVRRAGALPANASGASAARPERGEWGRRRSEARQGRQVRPAPKTRRERAARRRGGPARRRAGGGRRDAGRSRSARQPFRERMRNFAATGGLRATAARTIPAAARRPQQLHRRERADAQAAPAAPAGTRPTRDDARQRASEREAQVAGRRRRRKAVEDGGRRRTRRRRIAR